MKKKKWREKKESKLSAGPAAVCVSAHSSNNRSTNIGVKLPSEKRNNSQRDNAWSRSTSKLTNMAVEGGYEDEGMEEEEEEEEESTNEQETWKEAAAEEEQQQQEEQEAEKTEGHGIVTRTNNTHALTHTS